MTKLGDKCTYCGYYGENIGRIMVECCSRCNDIHDIGQCQICDGTGLIKNPDASNLPIIRNVSVATGGYICGLYRSDEY